MRNSFKIIPEQKVIIETYSGDFSFIEFVKLKWKQTQHKDYDLEFNYILDFQEVHFKSHQKYQDILYFIELYIDRIKTSKCAIITSNPNPVVESILLTLEAAKMLPIKFKVFSSFHSAYKWLDQEVEEDKNSFNFLN